MIKFFHTPCGHPYDCTGTDADLLAEQLRRIEIDFAQDLERALTTGLLGYRSSSMPDIFTQQALNAVAAEYPYPTPETLQAAHDTYDAHVAWTKQDREC